MTALCCPVFVCLSDWARFQFVLLIPSSPQYPTFDILTDIRQSTEHCRHNWPLTGDNTNLTPQLKDLLDNILVYEVGAEVSYWCPCVVCLLN